jgi:anti-anti-sigma factor
MIHMAGHDAMMPRMTDEPAGGAFRPPRFDVVTAEDDGAVVLRLSGELDLVSEPILAAALARTDGRPVRIELEELAFMDSTGLRALLSAAREVQGLELRGPLQPPVKRLLELTQTITILPFKEGTA